VLRGDFVSIPVRVFSLLRRRARQRARRVVRVSIPVRVFSLLRRRLTGRAIEAGWCFNPGAGFLPAATEPVGNGCTPRKIVSIPVRVFSLLRHPQRAEAATDHPVSIPVRVFSLLRLCTYREAVFEPRFQSRCGFSPCCDRSLSYLILMAGMFQSRCGFSPCCDSARTGIETG